jgi:hypothetical protein
MSFNVRNLFRFAGRSLFTSKGTAYRLSPKRIGWLLLFGLVYPTLEVITWSGLGLDEIFFRRYREEDIDTPIFIIGNPRSGTTFLHRLLAKDTENFCSMRMWEMFFAPSITMRKVLLTLMDLDRKLGHLIRNQVHAWEKRWQEENVIHRIALRAPEEDEYLLMHMWSALKVWTFTAMTEEADPYTYFDTQMPAREKKRIMRFYKRCLQRHLHFHDVQDRLYLAKDPSYSPMVDTLHRHFPNAKFIYLARNPLDMIPSYISLTEEEWQILGDPPRPYMCRDFVLDMAKHWYTYPLERLAQLPSDQYIIVNFEKLTRNVKATVCEIYERLELPMYPDFAEQLVTATKRSRRHESEHEYSLQEMGLTKSQIVTAFAEVFERFDFDTRGARIPAEASGAS